jgi:hypothetical protein
MGFEQDPWGNGRNIGRVLPPSVGRGRRIIPFGSAIVGTRNCGDMRVTILNGPVVIEKNRAGGTQCQEGRVAPEVWDTTKRVPPGAALQVRQRFPENAGKILCCLVASLQHLGVA